MLTCRELTELVTDYLEGNLSWWGRLRFQMHVGMCRPCRAYLRQMRQTVRALGSLPEQALPPDVHDAMMQRFSDWKNRG